MSIKKPLGRGQIRPVEKINESQDDIVECGEHEGCLTNGHATGIFAQGHIAAPVGCPLGAIFNVPVLADQGQEVKRGCLLWSEGGQAIDEFLGGFAQATHSAFELKDLCDLGPARGEVGI